MSRPGFNFCICPDSEFCLEHIQALLAKYPPEWQKKIYWGDEDIPDEFWQEMSIPDLMGGQRAIIVRRAQLLKAEFWKQLSSQLRGFKRRIWPFFCLEGQWNRGKAAIPAVVSKKKYFAFAQKQNWVWQSPGLTPQTLGKKLSKWCQEQGVQCSAQIVSEMSQILPLSGYGLRSELQKLLLYLGERKEIQAEDLRIFNAQTDLDIFQFLQALQNKQSVGKVWDKILREPGEALLFPLIGLMTREVRILWQLQSGEEAKVRLPIGLKNAKSQLSRRLGARRLARIFDLLLDADNSVKTGQKKADQALEFLVTNLARLFQ